MGEEMELIRAIWPHPGLENLGEEDTDPGFFTADTARVDADFHERSHP